MFMTSKQTKPKPRAGYPPPPMGAKAYAEIISALLHSIVLTKFFKFSPVQNKHIIFFNKMQLTSFIKYAFV